LAEDERVAKPQVQYPLLPSLLARMALASGVGYLAAAYTVSRWLTRPTRCRPQQHPGHLGLEWHPVQCRAADGIRLAGWVVEPPRPRATVVLLHGMRQSRQQILARLRLLVEHGYRCVAFDHRAHGESGGKRTSFGFHESRDVAAILDLVQRRWPDQPRAALGLSMGAAALCFAARHARGWDALVLESCYQDIGSAFESRLKHHYPPWYQRLSRGVVWVTERRLGVRLGQLAPVDYVADLAPTPVLILTGTEDPHAPPEQALGLFERCQEPRELLLVPNAGHRDVLETGGELYRERILDFLQRRLAA
jgi:alpha-beta hydrolase superfamily lysophospholipase